MILDTNAVSALFAGDRALSELLSNSSHHHLPVIVIGEFRYGLLRSRQADLLSSLLDTLIRESIVLGIETRTANEYAHVREELRAVGKPIPENDLWIAALARQHGLDVASRDRHFDQVENLTRRDW